MKNDTKKAHLVKPYKIGLNKTDFNYISALNGSFMGLIIVFFVLLALSKVGRDWMDIINITFTGNKAFDYFLSLDFTILVIILPIFALFYLFNN